MNLEEIIEKVDLADLEELESIVAPASGCGCGNICW